MAEQQPGADRPPAQEEPIPFMQELLDNFWLIFLLSGVFILVFYIIWALIDLVNVPALA